MPNPLEPSQMTGADRVQELADLLAVAFLRAKRRALRKHSCASESCGIPLDCRAGLRLSVSGHDDKEE